MGNSSASLDPKTGIVTVLGTKYSLAFLLSQPKGSWEYQVGCKLKSMAWSGTPATIALPEALLQAVTQQKISLPLDPRKGGSIHLSAEAVQLATSPPIVVAPNSLSPAKPPMVGPVTAKGMETPEYQMKKKIYYYPTPTKQSLSKGSQWWIADSQTEAAAMLQDCQKKLTYLAQQGWVSNKALGLLGQDLKEKYEYMIAKNQVMSFDVETKTGPLGQGPETHNPPMEPPVADEPVDLADLIDEVEEESPF